jgi:hypothetical protein
VEMTYFAIDELLSNWASENRLRFSTKYRDEEVRSLDVVSAKGKRYQIWVDAPRNGRVGVHVWDYRKRRIDLDVAQTELNSALDAVFSAAREWMQFE